MAALPSLPGERKISGKRTWTTSRKGLHVGRLTTRQLLTGRYFYGLVFGIFAFSVSSSVFFAQKHSNSPIVPLNLHNHG